MLRFFLSQDHIGELGLSPSDLPAARIELALKRIAPVIIHLRSPTSCVLARPGGRTDTGGAFPTRTTPRAWSAMQTMPEATEGFAYYGLRIAGIEM
jgi:hypothetical protein